jgi:hypothetical protein
MEQLPTTSPDNPVEQQPPLTKAQLWLLGGTILTGAALMLWMEKDFHYLYSVFWLTALAVFAACNWKRIITNKTVLALLLPTLLVCGLLKFDYMYYDLLGLTALAIPVLLLTIGVFTTQEIAYKREGKAVVGVLKAVFVKPFTASKVLQGVRGRVRRQGESLAAPWLDRRCDWPAAGDYCACAACQRGRGHGEAAGELL